MWRKMLILYFCIPYGPKQFKYNAASSLNSTKMVSLFKTLSLNMWSLVGIAKMVRFSKEPKFITCSVSVLRFLVKPVLQQWEKNNIVSLIKVYPTTNVRTGMSPDVPWWGE